MPVGNFFYTPVSTPQSTVPPFRRFTLGAVVDETPLYIQTRRSLLNRIAEHWYIQIPTIQKKPVYHAGMFPSNPIPSNVANNLNKVLSRFTLNYAPEYTLYIRSPKINFGLFVDNPPLSDLSNTLSQILSLHYSPPFTFTDPYNRKEYLNPDILRQPDTPPPSLPSKRLQSLLASHFHLSFDTTDRRLFRKILTNPTILFGHENPPPYLLPNQIAQILSKFELFILPTQRDKNFLYDIPTAPPTPGNIGFIAFQPNAFQGGYPSRTVAFQTFNRFIGLRQISISGLINLLVTIDGKTVMQTIRAGDSVTIACQVFDPTQNPPKLFDPEFVKLTLYDPEGEVFLSQIAMTRISIGEYIYMHQSSSSHLRGVYLGDVFSQNFGREALIQKQALFRLVD